MNKTWSEIMVTEHSDKIFFSWAPKSLQTVTIVMKLKDACSLEGKL